MFLYYKLPTHYVQSYRRFALVTYQARVYVSSVPYDLLGREKIVSLTLGGPKLGLP